MGEEERKEGRKAKVVADKKEKGIERGWMVAWVNERKKVPLPLFLFCYRNRVQ